MGQHEIYDYKGVANRLLTVENELRSSIPTGTEDEKIKQSLINLTKALCDKYSRILGQNKEGFYRQTQNAVIYTTQTSPQQFKNFIVIKKGFWAKKNWA